MALSPVEGLRLRGSTVFDPEAQTRRELAEVPTFAGHRSGLALSRPWERPVETYTCGPGRTCRRIIDENTPLVNNAG